MVLIDAANRLEDRKIERLDEESRYARIVIKLDDTAMVGTDIEVGIEGNYIAKISCNGIEVSFKFDERHNNSIYMEEFKEAYKKFDKIYLTNASSQSGKTLVLQIGTAAEIVPDTETKHMRTAFLDQDGDGVGSNFGTPGAGYAFVVLGYQIIETEKANMAVAADGEASLKFVTSDRKVWTGIKIPVVAVTNYISVLSGIYVKGGDNEALTLTNANVTAGSSEVRGCIFYRVVKI